MVTISKLPEDLVREILSRVPLTSLRALRCTCKTWNALSKTQIFGKKAARNQFLGFTVISDKVCSLRFDLQGIQQDLVDQSTKNIRKLDRFKMYKVFHSDGLLLGVQRNSNQLVVWNPYLGQAGRIPHTTKYFEYDDMFAFGYDNNNRNHKILRFLSCKKSRISLFFELYDFNSSSWRELDIKPDFDLDFRQSGVSLKGNTYFVARHNTDEHADFLLCFDFTTERFCPPSPFHFHAEHVALSCVREEQLAVLYQHEETMEIWITTKIEHNVVSWNKFLKVEMTQDNGFPYGFVDDFEARSFFIDEEKKVVVVSYLFKDKTMRSFTMDMNSFDGETAHIIGQDGYVKSVYIRKVWNHDFFPFEFTSYVPSLVQL